MFIIDSIFKKISFYIIIVGCVFIVLFYLLFQYKNRLEVQVVDTALKQFNREVKYMFELNSSSMIQNTFDCSYWDDFVVAINNKDINWIEDNLTFTNSYGYEVINVYDSNFDLLTDMTKDKYGSGVRMTKSVLMKLEKNKKYHFFSNSSNGIMEFTFTSVHKSNDPEHIKTLPFGYVLLGRRLDLNYLSNMTRTFGSSVQFQDKDSIITSRGNIIVTTVPLYEWNGKYLSTLVFSRELNHDFNTSRNVIFIILCTILLFLFITHLYIKNQINKPLQLAKKILETDDKESIAQLKKIPFEFGKMGELFERYVNQKHELNNAIIKSEESERLKSAFLANVSHEIRTPMNGILGFAELLKQPGVSEIQHAKYLEMIESSGVRLMNIVNNIVDISKIESGIISVNNSLINVNDQINFLLTFFAPEIKKKGLQFVFTKSLPQNRASIVTDADKFYGIFVNLMSNAIKNTQSGVIEVGYKLLKEESKLEFFVTDSGIGIPENKLAIIFDRFMQVDISNKTSSQGAGLGLSISKAYVEMQGGDIWVESVYNNGSTFKFTLPYTCKNSEDIKEEAAVEVTKKFALQEQNFKILIAEDDPGMEFLLTETVKDYCTDLLIARDGQEALEICKQNMDIDLILMDIRMPKMDGFELAKEIRLFNTEVVIVAQTSCAFSADNEMAISVGCNDYVSKPIDNVKFNSIIARFFEMHLNI